MSVTTGVRFRPVGDDSRGSEAARQAAKQRWSEALKGWPGVEKFAFRRDEQDPPTERLEVQEQESDIPPVDITIVWQSGKHASTLFDNSEFVANLNGLVGGAHAVHVVGKSQINGTSKERPGV